eukprot:MONOS_3556.1-p1 / transcript=MONOS_3556.1 / gene=MONOS_3556 / organism=Monocercomonoides_exilis_PA203 / gene_product=unspecified product / transcript_product=unspecified product / location=Mono_scaffold00084:92828-94176(+) / protein_length=423 / sequence_SO=supercontig / SO=protein_coding / is_pseudo=false
MFSKLEDCCESEQKKIIEEMNMAMEEMNKTEFETIYTKEMLMKITELFEEKKISMRNAIWMLKPMGHHKALLSILNAGNSLYYPSLRFKRAIVQENEKKEEKNENFLADLCECYLLMEDGLITREMLTIASVCLLKVALKKEEDEETQKEVETALLGLCKINFYDREFDELHLRDFFEIIKYHQEHRNLTRLAYQSAWMYCIKRIQKCESVIAVSVNELDFVREAKREFEEARKCVDWGKKGKEGEQRRMETKNAAIVERWIFIINSFSSGKYQDEEFLEFLGEATKLCRAARENHIQVANQCFVVFSLMMKRNTLFPAANELQKSRAFDLLLEEIQRAKLNEEIMCHCLYFFLNLTKKWRENATDGVDWKEMKKMKRILFDKMEEEGYEDSIVSLHELLEFYNRKLRNNISTSISDYFVNI